MRILIIGSGGREHALAWKVKQSPDCEEVFIAPGNAGTAITGTNVAIKADDFTGIKQFVIEKNIDFVIVGPEDPLVNGIVDFFLADDLLKNVPILGPEANGAQLEGSKAFANEFMERHDIPTASSKSFLKAQRLEAEEYINEHSLPIVMKADGLAAGKGVTICQVKEEALQFLNEVWDNSRFGNAGDKVVIEQFLDGIELSVFVITDGKGYVLLPEAKDYKKVGEGDTGPNTGGMGAISPVPFASDDFMQKVKTRIVEPTISGLQKENIPYRGFIFFGLINVNGDPYVIEYNVRMGDPETEVVLPRIASDLLPCMLAAAKGELGDMKVDFDNRWGATVIAVSGGYPGIYETGKEIIGLSETEGETIFFHAGTKVADGKVLTSGGRVLAATSLASTLEEAVDRSYRNLLKVHFYNMYYRKDIGKELMALQRS